MSSSDNLLAESSNTKNTQYATSVDANGSASEHVETRIIPSSSLFASHGLTRTQSWQNGMTIHICTHCERVVVDIRKRPRCMRKIVQGGEVLKSGNLGVTYSYARQAIEDGCSLFLHMVKAQRPKWWKQIVEQGKENCMIPYELRLASGVYYLIVPLGDWMSYCAGEDGLVLRYISYGLLNIPEDPVADFTLPRSWLDRCDTSHRKCTLWKEPFSPKRLLYMGSCERDRVRLVCPEPGEPVRYIALSYCWGADQTSKLTKENIERYTSKFKVETLSKTIRDAVFLTQKLEVEYLWVDALCIVQDDKEEMMEQIAQMIHIYRGAYVTIAAVAAASSHSGLFVKNVRRSNLFDVEVYGRLRVRCARGREGTIIVGHALNMDQKFCVHSPLLKRGWVFQEGILSSRILCVGFGTMRWFCPTARLCDGGAFGSDATQMTGVDPGLRSFAPLSRPIRDAQGYRTRQAHPGQWEILIKSYRERQLSYPADALVAVSAVAELYGNSGRYGRYLAGLWEKDLLVQLGWWAVPPRRRRQLWKSSDDPRQHLPKCSAPSWSWASVDDPVSWELRNCAKTTPCQLLDLHVELKSDKVPFGDVTIGHIRIRGRVKTARWYVGETQGATWPIRDRSPVVVEDALSGKRVSCKHISAVPDVIPRTALPEEGREIFCLELFPFQRVHLEGEPGPEPRSKILPRCMQETRNYFCGALILVQDPSTGYFRRVVYFGRYQGIFLGFSWPENEQWWHEGWEWRDITIV